MAKLSTARRNNLPKSDFGIPSQRKYPMPDRSHAANAKSRARQQLNAGHITKSEFGHIKCLFREYR